MSDTGWIPVEPGYSYIYVDCFDDDCPHHVDGQRHAHLERVEAAETGAS